MSAAPVDTYTVPWWSVIDGTLEHAHPNRTAYRDNAHRAEFGVWTTRDEMLAALAGSGWQPLRSHPEWFE